MSPKIILRKSCSCPTIRSFLRILAIFACERPDADSGSVPNLSWPFSARERHAFANTEDESLVMRFAMSDIQPQMRASPNAETASAGLPSVVITRSWMSPWIRALSVPSSFLRSAPDAAMSAVVTSAISAARTSLRQLRRERLPVSFSEAFASGLKRGLLINSSRVV